MSNINEQIQSFAGLIAKTAIDDNNWKMFGFKSRPKRGKFFNRFINKSTLAKRNFLLKELTLLSIIDVVEAIKHRNITEQDKLLYVIGILSKVFIPFLQMGMFKTSTEFISFLKNGIKTYSNQTFSNSFISRAKEFVDENNLGGLIAGSVIISTFISAKEGLILDRQIIAQQIKIENPTEKLNFHLDKDNLKIYADFAEEIINT